MPVDFGLLGAGGPASIPLKASTPEFDYNAEKQAQYTMQGKRLETQEQQRVVDQAAQERRVLEEASKDPNLDLYTPKGIREALPKLRDMGLSFESLQKVHGHAQKLDDASLDFRTKVATLGVEEQKLSSGQLETSAQALDVINAGWKGAETAKGAVTAKAEATQAVKTLLADPDAAKKYAPQVLSALSNAVANDSVSPQLLNQLGAGSKHHAAIAKEEYENQRSRMLARTGAKGGVAMYSPGTGEIYTVIPGVGITDANGEFVDNVDGSALKPLTPTHGAAGDTIKQYNGADGKMYFQNKTGDTWTVGADGNKQAVQGVPQGAKPVGYVDKAAATQTVTSNLLTNPTEGLLDLAVQHVVTGRPPVLGQNSALRPAEAVLAATLAQAPGGAEAAAAYKADSESLKNVTKIDDAIGSSVNTAENLLSKIDPLLTKKAAAAPTDIRLINKWINNFKRDVIGDEDLAAIDIFRKAIQSDVARVQSNVSGAGGTPVAFLKNGEVVLPENMPAEAYKQIIATVKSDMEARRQGNAQKVAEIRGRFTDSQKKLRSYAMEAAKRASSADLSTYTDGFSEPAAAPAPATPAAEAAPAMPAASPEKATFAGDPAAARAELKKLREDARTGKGDKDMVAKEAAALEASIVKGEEQIKKAFGTYDPDAYMYRIKPDGTVQRKKK